MSENIPSKVLYVDLSRRRFWAEDRRDLFEEYLGGSGVAIQLLKEECPKGADPLGPDNPIVFAVGPLTSLFPMASKTVAMFKSPLTGELGESHAGGRSAIAIRSTGYGAIVIKGSSDIPVYVAVHDGKVYFRDASAYWGMESTLTVGRVIRENEPGSGVRTIMRIGAAGERLVRYAMVTTETFRHFGRLGLGAVFGSKKLKAVVVSGRNVVPVKEKKLYRDLYDEVFKVMVESDALKKYHEIGTPINVLTLNSIKGLPTRNLKSAEFEGAERISGEYLAENFLGRRVACAHCPIACIHLAALREPYEDEPYFYKTTWVSYDYELTYALGSMLGISDTHGFLMLLDEVEKQGVDAMSTGVCLAWATEAYEKGLLSRGDLEGLEPKWGDYETYIKMVELIVEQPNEFYKHLAMGVEAA
ncbi:MAG: aldehyde ferredoxin oxidoreductase N-terminal domain-containing protein, partial [Candidatus Freyarchaeota archaeon]